MGRQKQFFSILFYGKEYIHCTIIYSHYFTQLAMLYILYLEADKVVPSGNILRFILFIGILLWKVNINVIWMEQCLKRNWLIIIFF